MAVAAITDSEVEKAATMDDLDDAARHLQDIAGITTGDVAGQCLNEKAWRDNDHQGRVRILKDWLKTEVLYED